MHIMLLFSQAPDMPTATAAVMAKPSIETRYAAYESLVSRAVEVFGTPLKATTWLSAPTGDLGNKSPLHTFVHGNPEEAFDLLGRIEHGVYF